MSKKILEVMDYPWMSTFFGSPILQKNKLYWCSHQYYTKFMSKDKNFRKEILSSVSGKQLRFITKPKYLVDHNYEISPKWLDENKREEYLMESQILKFGSNPLLREMLVDTLQGNKLTYAAPFDNFLGGGKDGKGKNLLPKTIMRVHTLIKDKELNIIY